MFNLPIIFRSKGYQLLYSTVLVHLYTQNRKHISIWMISNTRLLWKFSDRSCRGVTRSRNCNRSCSRKTSVFFHHYFILAIHAVRVFRGSCPACSSVTVLRIFAIPLTSSGTRTDKPSSYSSTSGCTDWRYSIHYPSPRSTRTTGPLQSFKAQWSAY